MNSDLSKVLPAFSAIVAFLPIGAALHAQSADELIKNGDGCYAKLQAANALRFYLPAERLDPNNERLLVHISREYRHLASDATKAEEKRKLNGIAVDYAKRAVALGPNDPDAQLAVAISYGKLQPLEGNWDKIEASRIIKDAADKKTNVVERLELAVRLQRERLAELALKHRLPTMFGAKENVEAGGLMSYGADRNDLVRRAAVYIDKILKGAKPFDLPVEQASKYQLVINLKTAKALGLDVPPSLLARADEVIE